MEEDKDVPSAFAGDPQSDEVDLTDAMALNAGEADNVLSDLQLLTGEEPLN